MYYTYTSHRIFLTAISTDLRVDRIRQLECSSRSPINERGQ